jgi:NAD(P)-dependent dehydrogenase (short-subunit alcohol dehydrogenase family)
MQWCYARAGAAHDQPRSHTTSHLALRSITVNAIAPGYVPSKMSAQLDAYTGDAHAVVECIPLGRLGVPADMAGAALFLASPAGAWITGVVLPVDGGFLAKL